jgi:hypothetical protein
VSVCVQPLPSLQPVPSTFAGFVHVPVGTSHVPARWHWSGSGHVTPAQGWTGLTATVPLKDPVKFEPPPPRAPPMTNDLKASGVPAGSEFGKLLCVLSSTGFTCRAL